MEYGGHHVYAGNRCGGNGRFHFVGPADHDRGASAAVVLAPFALQIVAASVGVLNPAVVGDIDKDRVFAKAFLVDVIDQFADCLIEPLHHRVVTCYVRRIDFTGVFVKQPLGRIVRGMGEKRRVPNEKRFVAGILNEVKNFDSMPHSLKLYIQFIEEYLQIPIKIISLGPERNQTIIR